MKLSTETVTVELKNGSIAHGTIVGMSLSRSVYAVVASSAYPSLFRCRYEHEYALKGR